MSGLLEGVRVLDLTRLLPGGFATALLGDLGAEVIKIEQPGSGDYMRWGEPKLGDESAHSWITDRNKRSVALDLKDPLAVEAFMALAATADIVYESFRPGVVDRLGIGYDTVREINPAIVYCSMSGYGQNGPLAKEAGHDLNYMGRAGLLSITGEADGTPSIPGVQVADLGGGASMSLVGILAALYRSATTGEGDHIDVAMTDGAFAMLSIHMGEHFVTGDVPTAGQMLLNGLYPCYRVYDCADGRQITVGALEPQFFAELCEVMGENDRVDTQFDPGAIPAWKELFLKETRDHWLELFDGHDVCVGPVNDFAEAANDSQLLERGMVVDLEHRSAGVFRQIGTPVKARNHPTRIESPAPGLGEHTEQYLEEAGIDPAEIARLVAVRDEAAAVSRA